MTRSFRRTGLLIVTGAVLGSGCASARVPAARLATAPTAERCTADVDGMDVRDWRQIRADGFTFCAPETWSRNERYDRITAPRRASGYASVSWAGPDTLQRVVFSVPAQDFLVENLRAGLAICQRYSINTRRVGDQDVCVAYGSIDGNIDKVSECPNGFVEVRRRDSRFVFKDSRFCPAGVALNLSTPSVTVTYGQPLVRVAVFGVEDAWAVAQTVRPASGSSTPGPY